MGMSVRQIGAVAVAVGVAACGARSEISGNGSPFGDASIDVGVANDGGTAKDGSTPDGSTAGADAAACITTTTNAACAGNPPDCDQFGCKFDVEWACGDDTFRTGGACTPPGSGPNTGEYQGVCDENGKQTSSFVVSTTTCDCKDTAALVTVAQALCTHQ